MRKLSLGRVLDILNHGIYDLQEHHPLVKGSIH